MRTLFVKVRVYAKNVDKSVWRGGDIGATMVWSLFSRGVRIEEVLGEEQGEVSTAGS